MKVNMSKIIELEDDPVIAERNVYLSHHIARKLFLLEYIPRTNDRPYELSDSQVKVKPNIPKLEMKIPMQECEEYICDPDFNLILSSKRPSLKTQNCAFGVYINDEFHLCSLPEILQMYPDIKNTVDSENKEDAGDEEDNKVVTFITPRIAARVTEAEKNRELASYQYLKNKEDQDPWVDVICKPADSHDISSITHHLSSSSKVPSEFYMTSENYFELCIPHLNDGDEQIPKRNAQAPLNQIVSGVPNCNNAIVSEEVLVNFAKEKLQSRTVMSLQQFQSQMNMSFVSIKTKQEMEDAIIKAGGVILSTSKTNPIYAIKTKGDKRDPVRECLVNLLITKPVLKMSYLRSILDKNGLEHISENDLKLVLKEYCTTKGGSWISKAQTFEEDNQKMSKKSR